jgi:adenine-specific DNA-methyltransferase
METGEALPRKCQSQPLKHGKREVEAKDSPAFLGVSKGTAYYFHFEHTQITTLDHAFLSTIRTRAEGYVVYADRCTLSEGELARYQVVFKKIPRDIPSL